MTAVACSSIRSFFSFYIAIASLISTLDSFVTTQRVKMQP
jgi:hypothetical protein